MRQSPALRGVVGASRHSFLILATLNILFRSISCARHNQHDVSKTFLAAAGSMCRYTHEGSGDTTDETRKTRRAGGMVPPGSCSLARVWEFAGKEHTHLQGRGMDSMEPKSATLRTLYLAGGDTIEIQ